MSFKAPSLLPRNRRPGASSSSAEKASESSSVVESGIEQVQRSGDKTTEDREGETEATQGTDVLTQESTAADVVDEEENGSPNCSLQEKNTLSATGIGKTAVSGVAPPPPPSLPYTEPHWSGAPSQSYYLTVIKSGSVMEEVNISNKPFQVFGRLPVCDVSLEHPSISRYHAVLQYRPTDATGTVTDEGRSGSTLSSNVPNEAGFYVYDLNSTHGSFLNKSKLQPRVYYRVRVGQMVRFGGSSRLFVLEVGSSGGSQEVVEAEAQAEIRELQREKEAWLMRQREREEERERLAREREEMGATWGMVMDEVHRRENEDEEVTLDPEREAYYKDDPKKALKKYFDREGLELEYEVDEEGSGRDKTYIARVTLPIERGGGEMLVVEESVRGKKKEAVVQCALKACRILDSNDMLHAASKRRQRLSKNWEENDYYDSDEDSFLDRTGELERKRRQRMKRLGKLQEQAESYDTLEKRLKEVRQQRQSIEDRLSRSQSLCVGGGGDSLDEYMSVVSSQLDPATITSLKQQALELKKEEENIEKLLRVAKPTEMPSIQTSPVGPGESGGVARGLPEITSPYHPPHPPHTTSPPDTNTTDTSTTAPARKRRRKKRLSSGGSGAVSEDSSTGGKGEGGAEGVAQGGGEGGEIPTKKRTRVLGPALPPQWKRDMPEKKEGLGDQDPEFASWLPPDNQTGDGRTHLNEKFGY